MPAMLNLITLYREALHEPDQVIDGTLDSPELVMDYFDTLIARNFSNVKRDSIKEFLGLNIDEEFDQNSRIAMQSIPLYCPAAVYEEYHGKYPGVYQDPFSEKEFISAGNGQEQRIQLPYLSMIEVFITPEIMARLDMKAVCEKSHGDCFDSEDREALRIYNAFYRDLHMLMEGFLEDDTENIRPDEKFIYCIYESISVGDFAIVIRSSRPETAFKVTTLLRERSCKLEYLNPKLKKESDPDRLVLYKTFTIFSLSEKLAGTLSESESGKAEGQDGKEKRKETDVRASVLSEDRGDTGNLPSKDKSHYYVLRGVLTNLYWSSCRKNVYSAALENAPSTGSGIRDILNDPDLMPHIRRLHGRYDFTVTLSERAFRSIHPLLLRYKLDRDIKMFWEGDRPDVKKLLDGCQLNKDEKLICETLIKYIWKGYVSYINERYLFSLDTSHIRVTKCSKDICLKPVRGQLRFTNEYIEDEIRILRERIRETAKDLQFLYTSRSSLTYSMKLLERLTSICSSVNGISDARIYSLVICRQIEAILNGLQEYCTYIEKSNDLSVVRYLDEDLKTAIESVNSFAQFILESTMQSFQTPIYNLESHVSVEKMLTAYSWLLQSLLDWFKGSRFSRQIRGRTQKYLTVMVPDGFDGELSTKSILFKLNDRNNVSQEKLLTVYCPSFADLTDFTSAFGIFLHEIAHYIRYESRYDRNRMILTYCSWLLSEQTADQITSDFILNTAELTNVSIIKNRMNQCFAEAFQEAVYPVFMDTYESEQMNLMRLIQEIKKTFERFTNRVRSLSALESIMNAFLNNSAYIVDPDAVEVIKCLKKIQSTMFEEDAYYLEPHEMHKFIRTAYTLLERYSNLWDMKEPNAPVGAAQSSYLSRALYNAIEELDYEEIGTFTAEYNAVQMFYRLFYDKCLHRLNEIEEDERVRRFYLYLFPERNRMFKEEGIRRLRRYVSTYIMNSFTDSKVEMDNYIHLYREVASDLYMVKVLELSPFGYLNFVVRNISMEGNLPESYLERFCRVIYALEGEEVEVNKTFTWQDVFHDIFKGLCSFLMQIAGSSMGILTEAMRNGISETDNQGMQRLQSTCHMLLKKMETRLFHAEEYPEQSDKIELSDYIYYVYSEQLMQIWEDFYLLRDEIEENVLEVEQGKLREVLGDIKHAVFLCQAFIQITERFDEKKAFFDLYPFLEKDLFIGNQNLDRMSREMKKSPIIKNYCSKVRQEFNEPETWEAADDLKKSCQDQVWKIDFIMDMHYGMIWRYASQIIEKSSN